MDQRIKQLKDRAEKAKIMYWQGQISRQQCEGEVMPYILEFNAKSKEIAKKYNQYPKLLNFPSFIR